MRVIVQLPCRGFGPLKREICEVFSRFMGGDFSGDVLQCYGLRGQSMDSNAERLVEAKNNATEGGATDEATELADGCGRFGDSEDG